MGCLNPLFAFRAAASPWLTAVLVAFALPLQGAVLWRHPGTVFVCNNGNGEDILHGALKPQDAQSASTLYFRFRVEPIADSATKSIGDFDAGLVFFEKGEEHLGLGNSREAWAYCALHVPQNPKGYADLNSATPEPGFKWEYMRAGRSKTIVFKVEFVPGQDARITVWLNPDLSLRASEINQAPALVTRFEARATFDEIHLVHRGKTGGWKFSQLAAATAFEDLLLPHFWQRGWFLGTAAGGLLLTVATALWLFERRRAQRQIQWLERERAVAAERARIAQDIHDEVGTSLTKISKLTEMMDRSSRLESAQSDFTRNIAQTARDTIQAMDEIVWAINPRNDSVKEMADYLVYFTEDFLRPTGVACHLEVPLRLPDLPVTAEVRHNLFLAVKEALNNAVRHAAPNAIKLGLELTADNSLTIEVADNGKGMDLEGAVPMGNGLENMRKRLEGVGGELQLRSQPGLGTTVKLKASLRQMQPLVP